MFYAADITECMYHLQKCVVKGDLADLGKKRFNGKLKISQEPLWRVQNKRRISIVPSAEVADYEIS